MSWMVPPTEISSTVQTIDTNPSISAYSVSVCPFRLRPPPCVFRSRLLTPLQLSDEKPINYYKSTIHAMRIFKICK